MSAKKKILAAASYVMVAALAVGGTVAFLTDEDHDVNVMTLGNVDIIQHEYEREVDDEGNFVTENGSYKLTDFTQFKPLLPVPVNPGSGEKGSGWDTTAVQMSQIDSYGTMNVFETPNAQDKFVTVENTGKTDAYVRTIVAMEVGSTDGSLVGFSHRSNDNKDKVGTVDPWLRNNVGTVEINGSKYNLIEFTYFGAQKSDKTFVHQNGILPAGETTYPSVCQFYLRSEATNEDVKKIDGNNNGTYDILVVSQAVQAEGFTDAETALDKAFGDITTTNHPWIEGTNAPVSVEGSEDFKDAVTNDQDQIVINLENDVVYDVAAWQNNAMGGASTESIIINGNGHTITFNNTNSDWDNVVTNNNAKLIINNAVLDNSGHGATNAAWNRHDINFACEVELNDVVSKNAIALKNHAVLNNVTIYDDHEGDSYALWIQAKGLTVEMDNCVIDSTGAGNGRGIKIDDQYLSDAVAKNTLVVKNTKFVTEGKAAIMVKSTAGADITLDNIDISGVAADTTNHVWVDEDAADYADLVTVTGGNKIVEN